jgi:hypothetical protein
MNKKYIPSGSSIQIETLCMVESLPDKARKTLKNNTKNHVCRDKEI